MANKRILDVVDSPADLKLLTDDELSILAREIREQIITTTSKTGGHVASSLGAVEIILAVHSLLNCPEDKFIFDVGHQSYAHKLVTGRRDRFDTLRTFHGISGFPKPSESEYDVHASGHASDSLSVAVGLAKARALSGGTNKIVALIGDAALGGGMAFEALNYIGQAQLPMVIILNDNEMSISRNVGALMKHLGYLRTSSSYRTTRDRVQEAMEQSGALGSALMHFGRNAKESMKQFVIPHSMIFEQLGIVCTAPIDGHNIAQLRETLRAVLNADGPVLMHVVTRKGQGYMPAVRNPEKFHGIAPYNIATGEVIKSGKPSAPKYTNVFGKALVAEAQKNQDIVAITAAMKGGTGLDEFAEKFPQRFVDTGICEEHAVGFAGGLAANGKKPVVALYSTFMQRAIDQMVINVALPKLDVVFAIDRAGIVGADGPTHHGVFDLVYARMVPNMRVLAPSNEAELVHALHTALAMGGPFAIRYPRGEGEGVPLPEAVEVLPEGKARVVREGEDVAILAFGRMVGQALAAADMLAERGIATRVVDMRWVKPLDVQAIQAAAETKLVVTVEEGVIAGGAGEGVLGEMARMALHTPALNLGIHDAFVTQGGVGQLLHEQGLDAEGIAASVEERYRAL